MTWVMRWLPVLFVALVASAPVVAGESSAVSVGEACVTWSPYNPSVSVDTQTCGKIATGIADRITGADDG